MAKALPIKTYLQAVNTFKGGNKAEAAQLLAEALGVKEPTPIIISSIDKLLADDSLANDAILGIVAGEVSKRNDKQKAETN